MKIIKIAVRDKLAVNMGDTPYTCGNSDFVINFDFDAEWDEFDVKTARFIKDDRKYQDVVFQGNDCAVPVLYNTNKVRVGVFAGNLHTSTPAIITANKGILCGNGSPEAPPDDVYAQIMEQMQGFLRKETDPTVPAWAKEETKPSYNKNEVGLGNVDNVKQYSASNPPPYPVKSVNGKTGAVNLGAADVGARPETWMPTATEVGALPAGTKVPSKTSDLTNDTGYSTEYYVQGYAQPKGDYALRKDLDQLSNEKVDQNQGAENAGKILVVGTDGTLFLTPMPEGGTSGDVTGILDDSNNILLTGNLADGTYTLAYEMADGTVINIGDLVVRSVVPPAYTNLADPASADWQEGYRLSISSGSTSEMAGHTTTNYIPCKQGDILRVKGLSITGYTDPSDSAGNAKIVAYTSSKAKIGGLHGTTNRGVAVTARYPTKVTVNGDVHTYTIMLNDNGEQTNNGLAYIRIDGLLMDGFTKNDVIITINEEITE